MTAPLPGELQVVLGVVEPLILIAGLLLATVTLAVLVHPLLPVTVTEYDPGARLGLLLVIIPFDQATV